MQIYLFVELKSIVLLRKTWSSEKESLPCKRRTAKRDNLCEKPKNRIFSDWLDVLLFTMMFDFRQTLEVLKKENIAAQRAAEHFKEQVQMLYKAF